ncbi:MAG TPA: hypothetical protein DD490_04950 [Acidobacteria bacterium]|nr:hypothetical protein [Acidobacteriota bacterium]
MGGEAESQGPFHLAWYEPHIEGIVSGGAWVRYLLVPVALPKKFRATRTLQVISHTGRPLVVLEDVFAVRVVMLRPPGTPEGEESPEEQRLIAALRERAVPAAAEKSLPELRATTTAEAWGRGVISRFTRDTLVRAGGG